MTSERSPALVRSRRNRVLGGVCAGVAERVGVDPLLVRLLTVLLALLSAGAVALAYVVLRVLLPEAAPESPAQEGGPPPPTVEAPGRPRRRRPPASRRTLTAPVARTGPSALPPPVGRPGGWLDSDRWYHGGGGGAGAVHRR